MARRSKGKGFSFISFMDDIERDFLKEEKENRREAAKHVAGQMRKNLSGGRAGLPGRVTGNLRKGVGFRGNARSKTGERMALVGNSAPHAHLLEFGHGDGKAFNKRPYFTRTFKEEKAEIMRILGQPWSK